MSILFFLLFLAAAVGIFKPYINGAKRAHFAIAAVVSFFLVGVFAPKNAPSDSAAAGSTSSAQVTDEAGNSESLQASNPEPVSKWVYSNSQDQMRGTSSQLASVRSENEVDLDFPYGEVRGQIWIRKRPEDGLNIAFEVDKGQVLCHSFSGGYVSLKFDDGPIQKFSCTGSSDGSSETAFLEGEQRALAALKKAKRTIVEAEFYQQGRQQFVFETAGLKWK